MQASWIKRVKRRWKRWLFMGLVYSVVAFGITNGQNDWENDEPWWEYEDETPILPADVRLKMFNLDKAYNRAGDYHNEDFKREYTRREHPNAAFAWKWNAFLARWVGFNDYYAQYQRSVLVNASAVSASKTYIDFDHAQLAGATRAVLEGVVDTARDLTPYLEDDIVIKKWEIFIGYLEELEDKLKDLR